MPRIGWVSRITGYEGAGTARLTATECRRLIDLLNKEYPEMHHYAIPDDQDGYDDVPAGPGEPE